MPYKFYREGRYEVQWLEEGYYKYFYKNKLHKEDGPAVIWGHTKEWWVNGKRHREDGPAFESSHINYKAWYYHGECIECESNEEFFRILKLKHFW